MSVEILHAYLNALAVDLKHIQRHVDIAYRSERQYLFHIRQGQTDVFSGIKCQSQHAYKRPIIRKTTPHIEINYNLTVNDIPPAEVRNSTVPTF